MECKIYFAAYFRFKFILRLIFVSNLFCGLRFYDEMDSDLWQEAGRIKATFKKVSLADCFALALAKREDATLVTSDHHEFDKLLDQNICLIYFIR